MNTQPFTPEALASSVIAVPPLARRANLDLAVDENEKLIRHLERGGVRTLLYGGNAILYHVRLTEYETLLRMLTDLASDSTRVVPSVGPAYGMLMDQAEVLRDSNFPTAMILPQRDLCTPAGVARATRSFVEAFGRPAVLYIKHDGYIDVPRVRELMDDGLLSWIKYAIVRDDPADDPYLRSLVDAVGAEKVVSGIGEQPAPVHLRDFGLAGFTSGCVCVAPRLSMDMLQALRAGDAQRVERIRGIFQPLEDLRNAINPVRVLHAAVGLAGLCETGPVIPLLCAIESDEAERVGAAAQTLLAHETAEVAS